MTQPQILRPASYVYGQWHANKDGQTLLDAVYGRPVAVISSEGVDFAQALAYGREKGAELRKLTFHTRARMLRALATYLMERQQDYYAPIALPGATGRDGRVDIEGGPGTL